MSTAFENGVEKARSEIRNRILNTDSSLIKQLKAKKCFGLIEMLKRGEITEDQARRSLAGDKTAIPLPKSRRPDEPLIFGKTAAEIARLQRSGPLK